MKVPLEILVFMKFVGFFVKKLGGLFPWLGTKIKNYQKVK